MRRGWSRPSWAGAGCSAESGVGGPTNAAVPTAGVRGFCGCGRRPGSGRRTSRGTRTRLSAGARSSTFGFDETEREVLPGRARARSAGGACRAAHAERAWDGGAVTDGVVVGVVLAGVVGLAERRLGPCVCGAVGEQPLDVPADRAGGGPDDGSLRLLVMIHVGLPAGPSDLAARVRSALMWAAASQGGRVGVVSAVRGQGGTPRSAASIRTRGLSAAGPTARRLLRGRLLGRGLLRRLLLGGGLLLRRRQFVDLGRSRVLVT